MSQEHFLSGLFKNVRKEHTVHPGGSSHSTVQCKIGAPKISVTIPQLLVGQSENLKHFS
jgi:hypothetical protein